MTIRALTPEDWPEVERIYAEGIATGNATGNATFETHHRHGSNSTPEISKSGGSSRSTRKQ